MAFIYVYCIYGQLVVTAVFDNNFPSFFFINPVFLVYGLTRVQMGEVNYLGNNPLMFNILFWIGASLLLQAVSVLNYSRAIEDAIEKVRKKIWTNNFIRAISLALLICGVSVTMLTLARHLVVVTDIWLKASVFSFVVVFLAMVAGLLGRPSRKRTAEIMDDLG